MDIDYYARLFIKDVLLSEIVDFGKGTNHFSYTILNNYGNMFAVLVFESNLEFQIIDSKFDSIYMCSEYSAFIRKTKIKELSL